MLCFGHVKNELSPKMTSQQNALFMTQKAPCLYQEKSSALLKIFCNKS